LERNDGGGAPTFRHAWTAHCASPAFFFRLLPELPEAAHPLRVPEKLMSPNKARCGLLVLAVIVATGGSVAVAQNLDQGKPAPKLFAESCASCHRSARGSPRAAFTSRSIYFCKNTIQRFQLGLGADVLSGIHRQRKARRGEEAGGEHGADIIAPAGAGAGEIGPARSVTTCSRLRCEISQACHLSTFAGLASWA